MIWVIWVQVIKVLLYFFKKTVTKKNLAGRGSYPIWWICYGACSPSFGLTKETNSRPLFSISQASVSKIFTTWITILYHVFKEVLITWPSKELVKRHLLKLFFKYPRTRVIIDCTELKIEKPVAHSSQKVTWSDYKSHNTFKLLECWKKPFKSV